MLGAGVLSLIFFGLFAFYNAIRHPFVHDDVIFILQNPQIANLNHWLDAFKVSPVSDGINTYYRPVLEILYRIEYHFFGPNPAGFHAFNVIVHIINGLLLFSLLKKFNLTQRVAWVIACLFLIHPVQTEAVACISGISNLWMALGVFLALHAYLKKWYGMSFVLFVIAIFSKEQAILFVPLVMVVDYSRGEKNFRAWVLWVLAACGLLWLRQCMTNAAVLNNIMASPGELYLRLAAIPRVLEMDLRLILCPFDLHYYRSTDILQSNSFSWVLALIILGSVLYVFKRWTQGRYILLLGFGWFLATLLPVLNIVPLINEYSFILTPEHFLYLPIVGILIVVVCASDYFLKRFRKTLVGLVIGACLLLSWYQNTFWSSEIALFERMLQFEPNFGRGHLLLAKAYYFNHQPEQADAHYDLAFKIFSNYAKITTNPAAEKFYLGFEKEILFDWAQNDCVRGNWTKGLDKDMLAIILTGQDAPLYNNIGFIYMNMGDKKNAYLNFQNALRVDPTFTQARQNLDQLSPP